MQHQIARMQQTLEELAGRSTTITIEHVEVHQPVIEKMEYRLDSLDIEQLSGSLNLGNNFGAKLHADQARSKADSPGAKVESTPSGFRVKQR